MNFYCRTREGIRDASHVNRHGRQCGINLSIVGHKTEAVIRTAKPIRHGRKNNAPRRIADNGSGIGNRRSTHAIGELIQRANRRQTDDPEGERIAVHVAGGQGDGQVGIGEAGHGLQNDLWRHVGRKRQPAGTDGHHIAQAGSNRCAGRVGDRTVAGKPDGVVAPGRNRTRVARTGQRAAKVDPIPTAANSESAQCPNGAVRLQCDGQLKSGRDGNHIGQRGREIHRAVVTGSPASEGAVVPQGKAVESTARHRHDVAQPRGHIGLAKFIFAPRHHGAIADQRQIVSVARGNGHHVAQAGRHRRLADDRTDAPCHHGAIRLQGHAVPAAATDGDHIAQSTRNIGLAVSVRTPGSDCAVIPDRQKMRTVTGNGDRIGQGGRPVCGAVLPHSHFAAGGERLRGSIRNAGGIAHHQAAGIVTTGAQSGNGRTDPGYAVATADVGSRCLLTAGVADTPLKPSLAGNSIGRSHAVKHG